MPAQIPQRVPSVSAGLHRLGKAWAEPHKVVALQYNSCVSPAADKARLSVSKVSECVFKMRRIGMQKSMPFYDKSSRLGDLAQSSTTQLLCQMEQVIGRIVNFGGGHRFAKPRSVFIWAGNESGFKARLGCGCQIVRVRSHHHGFLR